MAPSPNQPPLGCSSGKRPVQGLLSRFSNNTSSSGGRTHSSVPLPQSRVRDPRQPSQSRSPQIQSQDQNHRPSPQQRTSPQGSQWTISERTPMPPSGHEKDASQAQQRASRSTYNANSCLPVTPVYHNLKSYDSYFCEIETYTSRSQLSTFTALRASLQKACDFKNLDYTTVKIHVHQSAIPDGAGTLIFADRIFSNDSGLIAFLAPEDSQFIWFHWASDRFEQKSLENLLSELIKNRKIELKDSWQPGTLPYQKFWKLCQRAVYEAQHQDTAMTRGADVQTIRYGSLSKAADEGRDVNVPASLYRPMNCAERRKTPPQEQYYSDIKDFSR